MTLLDLPPPSICPEKLLKEELSAKIHEIADALDWCHLTIQQKSKHYEAWAEDPAIGGRLEQIMSSAKVRIYIKDTVMRAYQQGKRTDLAALLGRMGIRHQQLVKSFEKPRALLYDHTHLYTLTVAKEWRVALLSAYERNAFASEHLERNLVLITDYNIGAFVDRAHRDMIDSAGARLDVETHWVH